MSHLEQALARHAAGDLEAAILFYRAVLAEQPHHPDALHMMGVIAQQKNNPELALKLIEAALAVDQSMAAAWSNRAMVLRVLERIDEALQSAQQAVALDPQLADAWDFAGSLLRQQKKYDAARDHFAYALQLQPQNINFRSNYAVLQLATGDVAGAYQTMMPYLKSIAQATGDVLMIFGNILQGAGYPQRAISYYHDCHQRFPQLVDARVNEALAYLKIGDFEQGWSLWQDRVDGLHDVFKHIPKWSGEPVEHLALYEDQGFGDTLQALRYIPMLRKRVRKISFYFIKPALARLCHTNFPDMSVTILDASAETPLAGARCQLMSLPFVMKTRLDTIPASVPYIKSTPSTINWRGRLHGITGPSIGFVWAGNINYPNDINRSLHFRDMAPLIETASSHLVSMQKGPQKIQADLAAFDILDADPWLNDFTDTAELMEHLDLIITVDTAVAHMAGAMGKPVFLLLPFDPDWRWMLNREDSPWYPTMRLFRQTVPRDWTTAMQPLVRAVKKFIEGDREVLAPQLWEDAPSTQNKYALTLPVH